MALTAFFLEQHFAFWEKRLRGIAYPYREKWPRRLFHHAPLENAVKILGAGQLVSRADNQGGVARDIAGAGVITNRSEAHQYVRLYFRPRTPTQFHVEGIRKPEECVYGETAHAPVLIMFIFDALSILTHPMTRFSNRNMQINGVELWDSEQKFSEIPFDKVYSDGGMGGDQTLKGYRCAEVLAQSPLPIDTALQWIYCRSEAERTYMLNSLRDSADKWQKKIIVSDDLRVFEKKYVFVEDVSLSGEGLKFRLNPREDRNTVDISIRVYDITGRMIINFFDPVFHALPKEAHWWIIKEKMTNGLYRIEINLEQQRAFRADFMLTDGFM